MTVKDVAKKPASGETTSVNASLPQTREGVKLPAYGKATEEPKEKGFQSPLVSSSFANYREQ